MERWHLPSVDASGRREPRVLFSHPECRAVVIDLDAGEAMGEHSVRERAVVQVVTGRLAVEADGREIECGAGTLAVFEPGERHAIRALDASRLLLVLAPWPARDHYPAGGDADPERLPANASEPPLS